MLTGPRLDQLLQQLGHVERVAAGQLVELHRLETGAVGKDRDRLHGQPWQGQPAGRPLRRQLAERDPEQVASRQSFVAIGDDEQCWGIAEPPSEEAQQVQGRLVGPVDV